ncbi:MAG: presenilin family intramembrane aspartyl protease [Candidatus Woesearchaeota archaeon]
MKHSVPITIILILTFATAQLFGLFLILKDAKIERVPSGEVQISHPESVMGPRPNIKNGELVLFLIGMMLIGTFLILILARFKQPTIWKGMYFLAVWGAIAITLGVFIKSEVVLAIAVVLALLKVLKPNPIVHNITEIMVYSGVALIIVPLLTPAWAILLLIIISIYDMIAVWRSGHMITLAKFQMGTKLFSGLFIPYPQNPSKELSSSEVKKRIASRNSASAAKPAKIANGPQNAVLGGGDIVYPMIFAGVMLEGFIRSGLGVFLSFIKASIISVGATIALTILLIKSEKGKFYPAMPFISAGCLMGALASWLI